MFILKTLQSHISGGEIITEEAAGGGGDLVSWVWDHLWGKLPDILQGELVAPAETPAGTYSGVNRAASGRGELMKTMQEIIRRSFM